MAGYCGWSMSNNAVDAYDNGEMPISKWSRDRIISRIKREVRNNEIELNCSLSELRKTPLEVLKQHCLRYSSWHHTGKYYQTTDFYSLDIDSIEELTDEKLKELASDYKEERRRLKEKKTEENAGQTEEKWECCFPEWTGPRTHLKKNMITEIGIIKGKWFYRPNGHKKRVSAEEFRKIRQIVEDDTNAADNT